MAAPTIDVKSLADQFPASSIYITEHAWGAIVGSAMLGFGQEKSIKQLCEAIFEMTRHNGAAQTNAFRKLREGLLKSSPLVGFPRSIHGLSVFRSTIEALDAKLAHVLESDKSLRDPVPLAQRQARGLAFFRRIYAQHTERVLHNLNVCSGGDLGEFACNCVYGDLMAEFSILGAQETGLLEFVCCLTIEAVSQAKGHMFGAHNLGNSGAEIEAAVGVVRRIAQESGMAWPREDMSFLETPGQKGW